MRNFLKLQVVLNPTTERQLPHKMMGTYVDSPDEVFPDGDSVWTNPKVDWFWIMLRDKHIGAYAVQHDAGVAAKYTECNLLDLLGSDYLLTIGLQP